MLHGWLILAVTYYRKKKEQGKVTETCALKLGTHKVCPRVGLPSKIHSMYVVTGSKAIVRTQMCTEKARANKPYFCFLVEITRETESCGTDGTPGSSKQTSICLLCLINHLALLMKLFPGGAGPCMLGQGLPRACWDPWGVPLAGCYQPAQCQHWFTVQKATSALLCLPLGHEQSAHSLSQASSLGSKCPPHQCMLIWRSFVCFGHG